MKNIFMTVMVAISMMVAGCSWFNSNAKALSADGLSLVNCVVSANASGNSVEAIAVSCGVAAVSDVVSILDAAHVTPTVDSEGLRTARATTNPPPAHTTN